MLPPMEINLDTLRRIARLAGFDWTDAELDAMRPVLERTLETLGRLEALPLGEVEPATQYRVL
jgi:Asp-tRNA(Asn)/Glu-tRNA(Gln) amidotransferase C subunit